MECNYSEQNCHHHIWWLLKIKRFAKWLKTQLFLHFIHCTQKKWGRKFHVLCKCTQEEQKNNLDTTCKDQKQIVDVVTTQTCSPQMHMIWHDVIKHQRSTKIFRNTQYMCKKNLQMHRVYSFTRYIKLTRMKTHFTQNVVS